MSQRRVLTLDDGGHIVYCPACRMGHEFEAVLWTYNGDEGKPTFTPDQVHIEYGEEGVRRRCHFRVTKGRIEYLPDCSHLMAGMTVDLPEI